MSEPYLTEEAARKICLQVGQDPDAESTIGQSPSGYGIPMRMLKNWEVRRMLSQRDDLWPARD